MDKDKIDIISNEYNNLIRAYSFYGICSKCGKSIKVESRNPILQENIHCDCCKQNSESAEKKEKLIYNNTRYKLKRIWKGLCASDTICDTWKNDFEEFKKWSNNNGYKPWKSLFIYNENSKYSPDNCYWSLDGKECKFNISCEKLDDAVKNIKFICNKLSKVKNDIKEIEYSMASVNEYNKYIVSKYKTFDSKTENIKQSIEKLENILDKIDIDRLE